MYCKYILETSWLIFSPEIPVLLYYSHILTAVASFVLGLFVYLNNKNKLANKLFFLLNIFYVILMFLNLIIWTNSYIPTIVLIWPITQIIGLLTPILAVYFFYVFVNKKDISFFYKIIWLIIVYLLIILSFSKLNFIYFNIDSCELVLSNLIFKYQNIVFIFLFTYLIYVFVNKNHIKNIQDNEKRQGKLLFFGVVLFLVSYILIWQFAEHYGLFELEQYGLFGEIIFMAFLAYIIVKFKAFNIKLLGAQALVWALVILVGSQFLYMQNMPISALVLTAITLIISTAIGLLVVRSVEKIDKQKEVLNQINKNQEALLHFITHQVKGYLTKSRNIFDGIIHNDYGQVSEKTLEVSKVGFDSDTKGVETILSILKASDLKNGKTEFKKERVNISALLAEIVEIKKDQADRKGLELIFDIEPNIEIEIDPFQIREVFKNLISNSITYTQAGTIKIILHKETQYLKFSVIDTGIGLSDSDKKKLFTEGGKGEESLKVNVDSTGYGLYVAKQIVEKHQGKIEAISEGRGKGSEFSVTLPYSE